MLQYVLNIVLYKEENNGENSTKLLQNAENTWSKVVSCSSLVWSSLNTNINSVAITARKNLLPQATSSFFDLEVVADRGWQIADVAADTSDSEACETSVFGLYQKKEGRWWWSLVVFRFRADERRVLVFAFEDTAGSSSFFDAQR